MHFSLERLESVERLESAAICKIQDYFQDDYKMVRKALLIKLNYVDCPGNELRDSNEVQNIKAFLENRGYTDITILTDDPRTKGTSLFPKKGNMITIMLEFITNSKSGDKLFFYFSGHGGKLPTPIRDESYRKCGCIYPCDLATIVDDELRKILVDSLPDGVMLRCLLNCGHSGSVMDLPYRYISGYGLVTEDKVPSTKNVIVMTTVRDLQKPANLASQGNLTNHFLKVFQTSVRSSWNDFMKILQWSIKEDLQDIQLQIGSCTATLINETIEF